MRTIAVVLVSCLIAWVESAAADDRAGVVVRLSGSAIAVAGDSGRPLASGSPVHYGERITTDANTRLRLKLVDGAVITLGDHSTFTIQGFEAEESGTIFDITNGVFLGISGAIGGADAPMTIRSPLATIGIRGTTFWGRIDPGHVQVALLEGRRVFVDAHGRRFELVPDANGVDVYGRERAGAPVEQRKWGAARLEASMRQAAFAE